jgi:putative addiction module component (TIGR02574 family)
MTRGTLLQEALKLPQSERADVAAELLASLDDEPMEDPTEVEKAWAAEIERRARRVLAGESAGSPWEEVKTRLEERFAKYWWLSCASRPKQNRSLRRLLRGTRRSAPALAAGSWRKSTQQFIESIGSLVRGPDVSCPG